MPLDTRRVNGPAKVILLSNFISKEDETPLLDYDDDRVDGRKADEIRPMYMKAGIIKQANGSAYLETRGTKLIAAVYGPRDHTRKHDFSSTGHLTTSLKYAPFSRQHKLNDTQDVQSKEYSTLICEALHHAVCLEAYPKAQIDVYVSVIEENGDTLSHAIIAASVALADAGIQMLDVVTACSLVYNDDTSLLDPVMTELNHSDMYGSLTVAYLPSLNKVSGLIKKGRQNVDNSIKAINTCIEGCLRVHSVVKECLVQAASAK